MEIFGVFFYLLSKFGLSQGRVIFRGLRLITTNDESQSEAIRDDLGIEFSLKVVSFHVRRETLLFARPCLVSGKFSRGRFSFGREQWQRSSLFVTPWLQGPPLIYFFFIGF